MLNKIWISVKFIIFASMMLACAAPLQLPSDTEPDSELLESTIKTFEEALAQELTVSHAELLAVYDEAWTLAEKNIPEEELIAVETESGGNEVVKSAIQRKYLSVSEEAQLYVAAALEMKPEAFIDARNSALENYIYTVGEGKRSEEELSVIVNNYRLNNYEGGIRVNKLKTSNSGWVPITEVSEAYLADAADEGIISPMRVAALQELTPCGIDPALINNIEIRFNASGFDVAGIDSSGLNFAGLGGLEANNVGLADLGIEPGECLDIPIDKRYVAAREPVMGPIQVGFFSLHPGSSSPDVPTSSINCKEYWKQRPKQGASRYFGIEGLSRGSATITVHYVTSNGAFKCEETISTEARSLYWCGPFQDVDIETTKSNATYIVRSSEGITINKLNVN